MNVSEFDFDLPAGLIAQTPAERGTSKLLVLHKHSGQIDHSTVTRLPDLLREGDLLVVNDTKVFPARLLGTRVPGGGAAECLLLAKLDGDRWDALVHPGQKLTPGARMIFSSAAGDGQLHAEIQAQHFHEIGRASCRERV